MSETEVQGSRGNADCKKPEINRSSGVFSLYGKGVDIFLGSTVMVVTKPASMATAGAVLVDNVITDIWRLPRKVHDFYGSERFRRTIDDAKSLGAGEHVSYIRYIPDEFQHDNNTPNLRNPSYTVDFYPRGVTKEVAKEIADYQYNDLTSEDFYHRFNAMRTNSEAHKRYISAIYSKPSAMVLVMRERNGEVDENGMHKVIGSSILIACENDKYPPEFAFDRASKQNHKGIGAIQLRDMLAICEYMDIPKVVVEIEAGNHSSRKSAIKVNEQPFPWNCELSLDDGTYSGVFSLHSQRNQNN